MMRMNKRRSVLVSCFTVVTAVVLNSPATAIPAVPVNVRPVIPYDNPVVLEPSLQEIFGWMTWGGPGIDILGGQTSAAWFKRAPGLTGFTTSVVARYAGEFGNAFGIYDVSNPYSTATLFQPYAFVGSTTTVSFVSGGVEVLYDGLTYAFYPGDFSTFGFWLDGAFGGRFYSDDAWNGVPFALAYRGDNATGLNLPGVGDVLFDSRTVLLSWEDWYGADSDFQDFIVAVRGITPVPEPMSLVTLGVGSLLFAVRRPVSSRPPLFRY